MNSCKTCFTNYVKLKAIDNYFCIPKIPNCNTYNTTDRYDPKCIECHSDYVVNTLKSTCYP